MDKYRIDSHKLIYHPDRTSDWIAGKNIYPIYAEISPSGTCNHRCSYCALDFMEYQKRFLDTSILKKRLSEMGTLGLRSIMYAGEGEPFLHKDMAEIINHTKKSGIDVSLTTNGSLLSNDIADETLENITWIKVSINGASKETYSKIHRTNERMLNKVISNMTYIAKLKKKKKYKCTLGMQLLLLPDNMHEAEDLAKLAKEIGMNYLVIKPYSQHPSSKTKIYENIKYDDFLHLQDKLEKYNDENYSVIFRISTMKKWDEKNKTFDKCLALPFWSYIDAGGHVWGCSIFLENKRFHYGDINKETFKQIWEGEKRKKSLDFVAAEIDANKCRVNCRMDEINRYLWELKFPSDHVNFI